LAYISLQIIQVNPLAMAKVIDVNMDAVVVFTNKLEKMKRSALPNAIRETLNSTAFDVKKNTMPASADKAFIKRSPNFFRAMSGVEMAQGWSIRTMMATVGFAGKSANKSDKAVDDLEAQEYGGKIEHRTFIPMDTARGGSHSANVKKANRIGGIKKVVNSNSVTGVNPEQQFQHAAAEAGKGGFVIGNNSKQILFRVKDIGPGKLKLEPLFSVKKGRKVSVDQTRFMRDASEASAKKMIDFYIIAATKQFNKL
jgi:hypothetical protein